jgi:hypothetical protein
MAPYSHVPPEVYKTTDDGWLFEAVFMHVEGLLGQDWFPITNVEKLPDVPDAARHVWYAWLFAAEVGGNGLFDYLVNNNPTVPEIAHTLEALEIIGAKDMNSRLKSAIHLCRAESSELWMQPDSKKLESIELDPKYGDFDTVDDNIYDEIQAPFAYIAAMFIRENRAAL